MIRAVLDANIFVSALISPTGIPGQILRSFLEDRSFTLVLSLEITEELERSLFYPRVRRRLGASDEELRQWVASLCVVSELVTPTVHVAAVAADPEDNAYVDAALEGRARYIVSGDSHLLELERVQDVEIVTARRFLEILAGRRPR